MTGRSSTGATTRRTRLAPSRSLPSAAGGALLATAFLLQLCGLSLAEAAELVVGKVVAIQDGDTLTLLDNENRQHRIRLAGIDAPEKGQAFGQASRKGLAAAAFGRRATADCPKVDRYGRSVCVVRVGDRDLGLHQVERGLAWHYKLYEKEQAPAERAQYASAERSARESGRGLWSDRQSVPPWEWRRLARAPPAR